MSHTPGPWRGCNNGNCICGQVWSIPSDFPVATATWKEDELGEIPVDQMKSNAKLIAAAPDLLNACKIALSICGRLTFPTEDELTALNVDLYNAINKATI